jgi:hypothetical protein
MSEPNTPEPGPNAPTPPAGPPGESPPPPADTRPEYEFDAAQNEVLNGLTRGILWVRIPLLITGLLQILIAIGLTFRLHRDGAHIVGILGHGLAAIVCFLLSGWLLKAAAAFTRVTTTTGRDITNLMTGIRNLGAWFDMLAFFVQLYLGLLCVLLLLLLVGLFAGAFHGPG